MRVNEVLDLLNKSEKLMVEYECDEFVWYSFNISIDVDEIVVINDYEFEYYGDPRNSFDVVINMDYDTLSLAETKVLGVTVREVEFFISDIYSLEVK